MEGRYSYKNMKLKLTDLKLHCLVLDEEEVWLSENETHRKYCRKT